MCLFAILLPHSIKGSQHAWQIACLLWLVSLAGQRAGVRSLNRLSAPLLAYVTLSGISTALSPDPYLSWDRMKIVCLLLVGIVVAQNLHQLEAGSDAGFSADPVGRGGDRLYRLGIHLRRGRAR